MKKLETLILFLAMALSSLAASTVPNNVSLKWPSPAWSSALQASSSRIVRIDCFGDSFTGGGNGVLSYPGVLRESLGALSAGIGWCNSPAIVGANASTWSWMGPWQRIINYWDSSGGSFTYSIANGSKARLGLAPYALHDVLVYVTVDGGATNAIPVPWTTMHPTLTNIDLGGLGSHTLSITVSNNDMVWVNGIEVTTKETGILINNYGFGGWSSVFWNDALPPSSSWLVQESPDLAIFWNGLNDWSQNVIYNTFYTNMMGVVSRLTNACPSVVMLSVPAAFDGNLETRGTYNAAISNIVSLTGVDFIDMDSVWSSDRPTNERLGFLVMTNSDHPSQIGQNVIAAALRETYLRPVWFPN
jgi:hypothetical protein